MRKLDRVGHAVKRMYKLDHDSSSVSVLGVDMNVNVCMYVQSM